ncbi:MAG TPA: lysoplasmalogenase [Anaerolineae bacterium]|nr:lysoplasmalogenase [Anaerolineae bacterium]
MKTALYLIPILAVMVFFLIRAEFRQNQRQIYSLKPLTTLLVIAIAGLSFSVTPMNPTYTWGILIGLTLSLGGDIALMFPTNQKAFRLGLGLFLLAHVAYAVTFTLLAGLQFHWLAAAALVAIGYGLYARLRNGLGAMQGPVIGYLIIISVMVYQALATFEGGVFSVYQAWLVFCGAGSFYLSDVILAVARFWKPFQYHRISLAFYYTGQLLIALAASYFNP